MVGGNVAARASDVFSPAAWLEAGADTEYSSKAKTAVERKRILPGDLLM